MKLICVFAFLFLSLKSDDRRCKGYIEVKIYNNGRVIEISDIGTRVVEEDSDRQTRLEGRLYLSDKIVYTIKYK